jgi:hypothetical protein
MKIIIASLLLAAASVVAPGQTVVSGQAEGVKPPFTLTISYNRTDPDLETTTAQVVKAGSWVAFRIRKTNISDQEIPVRPQGCLLQYDVRDSSGNPVAHKKSKDMQGSVRGVRPAGQPEMLQPGESKILFEAVSSWYEIDEPGTYVIQVSECISNNPESDVVKSKLLTITVVPSDPPTDEPK